MTSSISLGAGTQQQNAAAGHMLRAWQRQR